MRTAQHFDPLKVQVSELRGKDRLGHPIDIGDDGTVIGADRLRQWPNAAQLEVGEASVVEACQRQSRRLPEEAERVVYAPRFEGISAKHRQCVRHISRLFLAPARRHDDHVQTGSLINFHGLF